MLCASSRTAWELKANTMRLYRAKICTRDMNRPSQRVSTFAESLSEAKGKLEAEHGKGNVYDLHNEEDEERVR